MQPWTAYDLVAQSRRSLHWFWPRSEAHLYAELKRLVTRGWATAELVEGRGRHRSRYAITPDGRQALADWLQSEPAPPLLELEGMLRMLLADQGSVEDLRQAIETTARQARDYRADGMAVVRDLLATGGPFPQRMHLVVPLACFFAEFNKLLLQWCQDTLSEIQTWPTTQDLGLSPSAKDRLERLLAQQEP